MRLFTIASLSFVLLALTGCSSDSGTSKSANSRVVPAGEKAVVGHLAYSVVDSQILTQLGEEGNPRVPRDRYLLVHISVTNSGNSDDPIPAVELVDDSGKIYSELTDGTGVDNWLGAIHQLGSGQTARGVAIFDAPAAHYRLRFSDETMSSQVLADLPLSYDRERDASLPAPDLQDLGSNASKTK